MAMKKIVYLLGAGASYNSVPIVDFMPQRLNVFLEIIKELSVDGVDYPNEYLKNVDKSIIWNELNDLLAEIEFYGTPDTLARKFYVAATTGRNWEKLEKLKNLLTTFFIFEQFAKDDFVVSAVN